MDSAAEAVATLETFLRMVESLNPNEGLVVDVRVENDLNGRLVWQLWDRALREAPQRELAGDATGQGSSEWDRLDYAKAADLQVLETRVRQLEQRPEAASPGPGPTAAANDPLPALRSDILDKVQAKLTEARANLKSDVRVAAKKEITKVQDAIASLRSDLDGVEEALQSLSNDVGESAEKGEATATSLAEGDVLGFLAAAAEEQVVAVRAQVTGEVLGKADRLLKFAHKLAPWKPWGSQSPEEALTGFVEANVARELGLAAGVSDNPIARVAMLFGALGRSGSESVVDSVRARLVGWVMNAVDHVLPAQSSAAAVDACKDLASTVRIGLIYPVVGAPFSHSDHKVAGARSGPGVEGSVARVVRAGYRQDAVVKRQAEVVLQQ